MKNQQDKDFTNRHPHVGFRTNPDVKGMLLQLQKDNGGTLSDTVESVVINGLDRMCSRSPTPDGEDDVDTLEKFDSYIQNIKDKAEQKGFCTGYHQCAIETRDKINGTLDGFNDDDDETLTCADCGAEVTHGSKFCGNCKKELNWDLYDDEDSQETGGILSGLVDSINNIFDGILGTETTSDNEDISENDDDDDTIAFTGGNDTPNATSDNDDDDESLTCADCGAEVIEGQKFCGGCRKELDWD